jgi:hypothetical protein
MRPTRHEIEEAAYYRWRRRGGAHGHDRDDWLAAELDVVFAKNYRYVARYRLSEGEPVWLGKNGAAGRRRCRFCERSEVSGVFSPMLVLPASVGNTTVYSCDVCEDCQAHDESALRAPFEAFARPLLGPVRQPTSAGIPAAALKAMVRMALALAPADEMHHFADAVEWVLNPDHDHDATLLSHLGCLVYRAPAPIASPFVSLARRVDDDAPFPYMVFFLGTGRVVFQLPIPLCPRDEDLGDADLRGPQLSMSAGEGSNYRASECVYLPVTSPRRSARQPVPLTV